MMTGSVAHTLTALRGVWHDHVEVFDLQGRLLPEDTHAGTPGAAPFDNLVYLDFDGEHYRQTNVTFAGRPLHARSFAGRLVDGVLVFDRLGPDDPEHVGVSGGPGVILFAARRLAAGAQRYFEPDWIKVEQPGLRMRTTLLYRDGVAVRTLTARGTRLSPLPTARLSWDPRGADGPVHEPRRDTPVFAGGNA
jgi:hypothetical protein